MSWSDWGKSKPEPKKDIDVREYIGFVDRDEPEPITLSVPTDKVNVMYDLSVKRLEFDITSDRIRTAYFLLFDKSTRGTIKQIKKQIKFNL